MLKLAKVTSRRHRIGLLLGGTGMSGLLAAALPAVGAGSTATVAAVAPATTVQIDNFKFAPPDLTVTAGTTVIWKNKDDAPHRVADINGAYASAALDTDSSFSHTFATPGVYKYFCSLHPYMKGEIVVKQTSPNS